MQLNQRASSAHWDLIQVHPDHDEPALGPQSLSAWKLSSSISSGYNESRWMTLYNLIPPCLSPLLYQFVPDGCKTYIVFSAALQ